jgi:hypothetical protein
MNTRTCCLTSTSLSMLLTAIIYGFRMIAEKGLLIYKAVKGSLLKLSRSVRSVRWTYFYVFTMSFVFKCLLILSCLSLHLSISSLVVLPTRHSLIFLKFYTRLQGITSQMILVRIVTARKPETPHTCIGSTHSNSCYNTATITDSLHEQLHTFLRT